MADQKCWVVRRLEDGQFESAYWQRPANSAEEAVELAVRDLRLEEGVYLAVPIPWEGSGVLEPMPAFDVAFGKRPIRITSLT